MRNSIDIQGETWHTKKALCRILNIQKSLFYEMVKDGRIVSRQLFDDSIFKVYKQAEITEPND